MKNAQAANVQGPDRTSHDPRTCVCQPCHIKRMSKPSKSIAEWCREWQSQAK